jgi:DNA-directed RNA polymerase specialized sigma subunit
MNMLMILVVGTRGRMNGCPMAITAERYDPKQGNGLMHVMQKERAMKRYRNHASKLTEKQVIKIRDLKKKGDTQRSIAKLFGVHESIVSQIINGKLWAHVKGAKS